MKLICSMWDDGLATDLKLIEFLKKNNLTTCFALTPGRYKKTRKLNDYRNVKYGKIVSSDELKEFETFEIANHSWSHPDFKNLTKEETQKEVLDAQKKLQDYYQKEINGFCYPYGVKNKYVDEILSTHTYARTTGKCILSPKDIHPTHKWDDKNLINYIGKQDIFFWGHTYEIQNWDYLKNIYMQIKDRDDVKLVTVEEFYAVCR